MKRTVFKWIVILISIFSMLQTNATANYRAVYFQAGDYFTYDLYWSLIKVGEAKLQFRNVSWKNQDDILKVDLTVRTWGIADTVFKVRDHVESWIDTACNRSVYYKKKQREGKTKRDVEVNFDLEKNTCRYLEKDISQKAIPITSKTLDPLALITALSRHEFANNAAFSQFVTDGKKLVQIDAWLKDQKLLYLKSGTYDAHCVEVSTKELRGVFEKNPHSSIEIWFSKHTPSIPLRIESQVKVGSFYGEMRECQINGQIVNSTNRDQASSGLPRKSYEESTEDPI